MRDDRWILRGTPRSKSLTLLTQFLLCLALPCLLFLCESNAVAAPKPPSIRFITLKSGVYLYLDDVARFYGMTTKVQEKEITLSSRYSTIKLAIDSRVMTLNNVQMHLSRAIMQNGRQLLIGKSDFTNLLEPVLRNKTLPRRKVRHILIDPGHGGKDVGAVSGNIYEKNINLQVAQRLAKKLQARGYRVSMTRTKDEDVPLEERVNIAKKLQPDAFISLHCNSASSSVTGLEIYIATPAGDAPTNDYHVSKKACPANAFNTDNAFLAFFAQQAILLRTGMVDRGIRRRRYYVVRNVPFPCMLVEMGFISNKEELAQLRSAYRQELIADAITEAVGRYKDATK